MRMTARPNAFHGLVALLASAWLAGAGPVRAQGVPSPANSTAPQTIALVGATAGVPAQGPGAFEVVIRDLANNPLPGVTVTVDLSNATEMHLCADVTDPDAVTDCVHSRVSKRTDAAGRVRFTLLGGSDGAPASRIARNAGRIDWNGTLVAMPNVVAYDLDGANGVGINDLSIWLQDFGSSLNPARGDYDGSGAVGVNDLSMWLSVFGSGSCLESCGVRCP